MALPLFGEVLPQRPVQRQSRITNLRITFSQLLSGAPSTPTSPQEAPHSTTTTSHSPSMPKPQLLAYSPMPSPCTEPMDSPSAYSLPSPPSDTHSHRFSILSLYRSPTLPSPTYAGHREASNPAADPEEEQLVELVQEERRRRRRRRRHHTHKRAHRHNHRSRRRQQTCWFPSIRDPMMRRKFTFAVAAGFVLLILLITYISLAVSKSGNGRAFHILFILAILGLMIYFLHCLIRLYMLSRPQRKTLHESCRERIAMDAEANAAAAAFAANPMLDPFVIAEHGDEEQALGVKEEETVKVPPPAYGLWRGSVRVEPTQRVYWQMREQSMYPGHPAFRPDDETNTNENEHAEDVENGPVVGARPPEYHEGWAF